MQEHLFNILNHKIPQFQSIIEIKTPIRPINFEIPKEIELNDFNEAEWGANLTFSSIPYKDFLFLFFALMLENKIVLVSKNMTLLTASMFIIFFNPFF